MRIGPALVALIVVAASGLARADGPAVSAEQRRAQLKELVGRFQLEIKRWTMAKAAPASSEGLAEITSIMGGRYVREDVVSENEGRAFQGLGLTGWDEAKEKFVSVWIDSMTSGMRIAEGTCDAPCKRFDWTVSGGGRRVVTRILDEKKRVVEVYEKGSDGHEYKSTEILYARL